MEDLGGRQQGVSGFGSASCGPVGKQLTVIDVHPSILRFSCLGLLAIVLDVILSPEDSLAISPLSVLPYL